MAESSNTAVTITAIIAILVIVGLVFYFVREETSSDIEIDLGAAVTLVDSAVSVEQQSRESHGIRPAFTTSARSTPPAR